jgi:hypothetical protein
MGNLGYQLFTVLFTGTCEIRGAYKTKETFEKELFFDNLG